jgi:hypothetical protein
MSQTVFLILFQMFLLILLADFVTGLIHWWEDTYV